jgi:hypothetical protein
MILPVYLTNEYRSLILGHFDYTKLESRRTVLVPVCLHPLIIMAIEVQSSYVLIPAQPHGKRCCADILTIRYRATDTINTRLIGFGAPEV